MKWEYRVVDVLYGEVKTSKGKEPESEFLNRVGADGWELVAATGVGGGGTLYLKRPKP